MIFRGMAPESLLVSIMAWFSRSKLSIVMSVEDLF